LTRIDGSIGELLGSLSTRMSRVDFAIGQMDRGGRLEE
jgi:hypothetical protein